jgi:hypothetical protein
MPGIAHEGLVELLRRNPLLAVTLLDSLGVRLPGDVTAVMAAGELTSPLPTELRADAVITVTGQDGRRAVVIEVQTSPDPDKQRVWPAYLAMARAQHDCPTILLVICPSPATGRWARQAITTGHPGFTLTPLVIDATTAPSPGRPGSPGPGPELAVLGALTGAIDLSLDGGRRQVLEVLAAADLDEDRLETYTHLVRAATPVDARAVLEALMATAFKDDFIERYKAEGRAEGVAQGKAEGAAQGKASMVLRILAARGFDIPAKTRDAVMSCTDLGQLDRWGEAAATAAALSDIFNGDH